MEKNVLYIFRRFLLAISIFFGIFIVSCGKNFLENTDADILRRGNYQFIIDNGIESKNERIAVGKYEFKMTVLFKKGPRDIRIFVPHDSEDAAFDCGLRAIKDGGIMVALENKEERTLHDLKSGKDIGNDPNRMFYEPGYYWSLSKRILDILLAGKKSGEKFLFALHNNRPDGDFILPKLAKRKNISIVSDLDPDKRSMIWIPGEDKMPCVKLADGIEFYKRAGLNAIYEYVPPNEKGFGSLSNYSAKNKIPYVNIEVLVGKRGDVESEQTALQKQMKYLAKVREFYNF